MDGVPEETQKGTGVPYDLGDLVLGTNDRSHQSEGKRMCKATEGNILKWPRIPKWLEFDGSKRKNRSASCEGRRRIRTRDLLHLRPGTWSYDPCTS